MRTTMKVALGVMLSGLVSVCVAPAAVARGGQGVISINGRVGEVQMGSSVKAVRDYAGRPTRTIRSPTSGSQKSHLEYRYECGRGCSTSYYFTTEGRLANFGTTSRRWRTASGTRVGDDAFEAEAREGKNRSFGCGDGSSIKKKRGRVSLFVTFFEAVPKEPGTVDALAMVKGSGVLHC